MTEIQPGDRVLTRKWGTELHGTVSRVDGGVYVRWDDALPEDRMAPDEIERVR